MRTFLISYTVQMAAGLPAIPGRTFVTAPGETKTSRAWIEELERQLREACELHSVAIVNFVELES